MGLEFDFDLENMTPEEIESGGRLTPGWYTATVESVDEDPKSRTGCTVFQLVITRGGETQGFNGRKHFERLYESDSDDPQKVAFAKRRQMLFAKRLGLIRDDHFAAKRGTGSWADATGTEVFLHIVMKESKKDGQPTGESFPQMAFDGIFPLNETDPKHLRAIDRVLLTAEQCAIVDAQPEKAGRGSRKAPAPRQPPAGGTGAPVGAGAPAGGKPAADLPRDSFDDF